MSPTGTQISWRGTDNKRKKAGQKTGVGGPYGKAPNPKKKGPSGERGRDRRRRAQQQDEEREKNVGVDEEHSRVPKGPLNNQQF